MRYWLSKPPVLGMHIGGFNILFEDLDVPENATLINTNVTASIDYLKMIHEIGKEFTEKDGLQR